MPILILTSDFKVWKSILTFTIFFNLSVYYIMYVARIHLWIVVDILNQNSKDSYLQKKYSYRILSHFVLNSIMYEISLHFVKFQISNLFKVFNIHSLAESYKRCGIRGLCLLRVTMLWLRRIHLLQKLKTKILQRILQFSMRFQTLPKSMSVSYFHKPPFLTSSKDRESTKPPRCPGGSDD